MFKLQSARHIKALKTGKLSLTVEPTLGMRPGAIIYDLILISFTRVGVIWLVVYVSLNTL